MSKLRENVAITEGELSAPPEGDLAPYVVFTQLTANGPYIYAGWLDAADDDMAVQFAREHYGQDQKCECLWAIPRAAMAGTELAVAPPADDEGSRRPFEVFTQKKAGDQHRLAGSIEAATAAEALDVARRDHAAASSIWVAPRDRIIVTDEDDVIWRHTDQTYRLARGYASDVRAKWERIRAQRDIEDYEQDDLKEMF